MIEGPDCHIRFATLTKPCSGVHLRLSHSSHAAENTLCATLNQHLPDLPTTTPSTMNVKTDVRTQKLSRVFEGILRGKQPLTRFNSAQFIEAICVQPNPVTCISRLTTSDDGLVSLQKSMHFDLSTTFFNGIATGLLKYLQDPTLKEIGGGEFLNRVLLKIVEPPVFWADFA